MNETQIRTIIRQEIQTNTSSSRFALNSIPKHIHNDIDSPTIYQPTLIYTGKIAYNGSTILLPRGWTATQVDVAGYSVTHNLNTLLYTVIATPTQSLNNVVSPVVSEFQNTFEIYWFDSASAQSPTSFDFALINVANKAQKNPTYTGVNL